MRRVKPQFNSGGDQLVLPNLWSHGLRESDFIASRLQNASPQEPKKRQQEKNNFCNKAVVGQISFSGVVFRYIVYIPDNSNLWSKLPDKRPEGEG